MLPINLITAVLATTGFAMVLWGYAPLVRRELGPMAFHLVRGAIGVAAISLLRLGYWDVTQYITGDAWPVIREMLGGQQVSAVFNLLTLMAIRDFLKARYYAIPVPERHEWHWWSAWLHPNGRTRLKAFPKE